MDRLENDTELQDFIYRKVRQARTSEKSLWERVKKHLKNEVQIMVKIQK